jgi:hypothetical protein
MDAREWLFAAITSMALCAAIHGQQPPGASEGGAQPGFQRRLNSVVQRGEGSTTNQPSSESLDPLAFYRKNPELMRRYFPHLFQGDLAGGAAAGRPGQPNNSDANAHREWSLLDSFSFPGGTAAEFVEILKKQVNPPPNIIVAPKLTGTPVPEFELKNVTLADIFQALNNLSEDKSVQWQLSGSTEPIWVLNPTPGANNAGAAQPVSGFGSGFPVDPLTGMPIPTNNGRICQILPLGKYLGEYKVEDITTAVKTAWSMMGDDSGAQLKYHTDTKLLIAVGTSAQLSILSQVLTSLESGMEHARKTSDVPLPSSSKLPKQ